MRVPLSNESTRRRLPRWLRRLLDPPETLQWFATGPPDLSLGNRAETMRACRELMARQGLTEVAVFSRRWWQPVTLTGAEAEVSLDEDEQHADEIGYWWSGRVCWSTPDHSSRVLVDEDYDGNDLSFVGWGERAAEALPALADLLLSDRP